MLYNTINKYIPQFVAVLLAVLIVFATAPTAYAEGKSGSCGTNLNWTLSGGTLTITGSGAMTDYPETDRAPWHEFREQIIRIVLPEGLTTIGDLAFFECENVTAVNIPDSVMQIGKFAFTHCTSLEMLTIGSGVQSIGESAFANCYSLVSVRIPSSVKSIEMKAFYRCETITTVTVPQNVTYMGLSVFGYCKNLVSADIRAKISVLPEYTFFGCEKLVSVSLPETVEKINKYTFSGCDLLGSVYYNGDDISAEDLSSSIGESVPDFSESGSVSEGTIPNEVSSGSMRGNEDGSITGESITGSENENGSVSTKVEMTVTPDGNRTESNAEVTVTVGNGGWEDAKNAIENAIGQHGTKEDGSEKHVDIKIYLSNGVVLSDEFVQSIAGRDVTITVMTADGSVWKINGDDIDAESETAAYNLAYELSFGEAELSEELGTGISFVLRFLAPAEVNAEVLIRIGPAYARQNATLFQRDGELKRLQSVVVDSEGYAHFYLASVTEETEYYIAMNLPDAEQEAIIPENMLAEYGNPEYTEPIKYEITGRTSSWGMNLGQVMGILAAVMVTVIVVVGVTMFVLNKRKLRAGYVPQWEDEEEEP